MTRALSEATAADDRAAIQELIAEWVHPDCEWTALVTSVEGRTYRGEAGMLEFIDDLLGSFTVRYDDQEVRVMGESCVLYLSTMQLRGRGSGVEMSVELGTVWEFEDGRVRRGRAFGSHREAREHVEGLARA